MVFYAASQVAGANRRYAFIFHAKVSVMPRRESAVVQFSTFGVEC
jgi:hypothetical protein